MWKCRTCIYFPCTKNQCILGNQEGCDNYEKIITIEEMDERYAEKEINGAIMSAKSWNTNEKKIVAKINELIKEINKLIREEKLKKWKRN